MLGKTSIHAWQIKVLALVLAMHLFLGLCLQKQTQAAATYVHHLLIHAYTHMHIYMNK